MCSRAALDCEVRIQHGDIFHEIALCETNPTNHSNTTLNAGMWYIKLIGRTLRPGKKNPKYILSGTRAGLNSRFQSPLDTRTRALILCIDTVWMNSFSIQIHLTPHILTQRQIYYKKILIRPLVSKFDFAKRPSVSDFFKSAVWYKCWWNILYYRLIKNIKNIMIFKKAAQLYSLAHFIEAYNWRSFGSIIWLILYLPFWVPARRSESVSNEKYSNSYNSNYKFDFCTFPFCIYILESLTLLKLNSNVFTSHFVTNSKSLWNRDQIPPPPSSHYVFHEIHTPIMHTA